MDNNAPTPPTIPEESVVVPNISQSPTIPNNSGPKPKRPIAKIVATLFGILVLVGAVVAGVIVVSNQNNKQLINQQAAEGGGCTQTGTTIDCTGTGPYNVTTCHSDTNTGVNYPDCATNENCNTQVQNGPLHLTVSAPSCGSNQVDVQELGGGICAGSGQSCTSGGQKACGETCSSDSECYPTGANGATERCISGTCQNTACVGKTVPGRNCDCSTLNACGQSCSAAVGLCQSGSECGFITTASQCVGAEGDTTKQFCLPVTPNNGYTKALCNGIAASYLVSPSGQSGTPPLTQQDVIQACAPQATASPSPTATATLPPITASCTNLKTYDTSWVLLTEADLAKLKVGDHVRFAVTGTTTGAFDKARFTVNNETTQVVTTKKPGDNSTYYYEYTIPAATTTFRVTSQLYSVNLQQWF